MKPTIKNRIKLYWHCLVNFHCKSSYSEKQTGQLLFKTKDISCHNCNYGRDKKEVCDTCGKPSKEFIQCMDDKCCPVCATKFEKFEKEREK